MEPGEGDAKRNWKPGDGYTPAPRLSWTSSRSQRQDVRSAPEDHRFRFYECYRKVAEKYDRDLTKNYNGDLNMILIPVSSASCVGVGVLIRGAGQSVLCRDFHVHHRRTLPDRPRPER